jgi:multidrug resistance efflux pump
MRSLFPALAALAFAAPTLPVLAQDQGLQRQLIQRQQQSGAFQLQLRQSQERLQVPPGDLKRQQDLDARQVGERQRLDNVSARQLNEIRSDTPQELRPYERQKAEDERRPLTVPAKEPALRTGDEPRPLPASPRGIVQVIEAPR